MARPERATAGLGATIPALPVQDVPTAVAFYRERFGFDLVHEDSGFAVLVRDGARLHLWQSADESWRTREALASEPIRSGAESFLAGTASCRIETADVDALFAELEISGVLHQVSRTGPDGHGLRHPRVRRPRPRGQPDRVLPLALSAQPRR